MALARTWGLVGFLLNCLAVLRGKASRKGRFAEDMEGEGRKDICA